MANIAKVIRHAIEKAFELEDDTGTLHAEMESFRATILHDITPHQFADMYAQTVCYGLFSARENVPDSEANRFTREHAAYDLPKTNPFLREAFEYIAGTKLDPSIVWAVDVLADVLRHCDMSEILKHFGKAGHKQDPVLHFYETFLAAYDPDLRQRRGIYYTPEPVVQYVVASIDVLLKRDLACTGGLANNSRITLEVADPTKKGGKARQEVHRVQILDPAAGTGTFLYQTIGHIHDALSPNRGLWAGERGYVAQHLLPRLHGFELMMAPYAVAHMKLGWLLKETGYDFPHDERLRVYLTNTLEEAEIVAGPLLALANQIAREANAASKVKAECPIMVILGNPPYSGLSANMNEWIDSLLKKPLPLDGGAQAYYTVDGKPLGEKKVWLQDDYVKFIRFAQYRIERTGYGILGFITNHGYLENPTFRGMRQSLMATFDDIYVLDLHGSSKKREKPPEGGKDENVFDITTGVAIGLFVKRKNGRRKKPARVFHAERWGTREAKGDWLAANDVTSTQWTQIKPNSPHYFFVPVDEAARTEYEEATSLAEALPVHTVGVVTARDKLTVHFSADDVWTVVKDFCGLPEEEARDKYALGKDVRDWRVALAQADVRGSGPEKKNIRQICYRPFDTRFTYYTGKSRGFIGQPQKRVMRNMFPGDNLALCTTKRVEIGRGWEHVFCTRTMIQHHAVSMKEVNYLFPVYVYPDSEKMFEDSAWPPGKDGRRPNLTQAFVDRVAELLDLQFVPDGRGDLKKTFGPEDIFHYAYAVFHSPTYRERYAEFLKVDFPRLPLTGDRALFATLAGLGEELVGLHLLEHMPAPQTTYPQPGDNRVERIGKKAYKAPTGEASGRVYINKDQYFEGVPSEVWGFHLGGYQVCEKWLKDRKGRVLGYDDIEHYRGITEAVRQTLRLMDEIDEAIPSWPLP